MRLLILFPRSGMDLPLHAQASVSAARLHLCHQQNSRDLPVFEGRTTFIVIQLQRVGYGRLMENSCISQLFLYGELIKDRLFTG